MPVAKLCPVRDGGIVVERHGDIGGSKVSWRTGRFENEHLLDDGRKRGAI
jgi:hypothetical protein